ncbi:MAG: hypothetical protein DRI61_09660, partial [Chloroflexi bacterium]
ARAPVPSDGPQADAQAPVPSDGPQADAQAPVPSDGPQELNPPVRRTASGYQGRFGPMQLAD